MKTIIRDGRVYAKRAELTPWDKNPREIEKEKLDQLVADIKDAQTITPDGQIKPLLVTKSGVVVGGNMRMQAFAILEIEWVWVNILDTDDPVEGFKWAMRDNMAYGYYLEDKVAEIAIELNLDDELLNQLEIPSGEVQTIAEIIEEIPEDPEVNEDEVPEAEENYVSRRGEVYQLGKHRLMCGDSTSEKDVAKLMNDKLADMVFTDPPYNVDYKGAGKNTRNGIKNDKMSAEKFQEFLDNVFKAMRSGMKPTAPAYVCYASREHRAFENGLEHAGFETRSQIVWVKPVATWGFSQYRWKHELILFAVPQKQVAPFYGDRKQYTHWEFKPTDAELLNWSKSMLTDEEEDDVTVWKIARQSVSQYEHPTSKPVKLPAKAILNSSRKGEIVLDLFGGGGLRLLHAKKPDESAEPWSWTRDMSTL